MCSPRHLQSDQLVPEANGEVDFSFDCLLLPTAHLRTTGLSVSGRHGSD